MEKYLSIHNRSFTSNIFWKEIVSDRVKVLESNVLNCCLKITTADLRKILKISEGKFAFQNWLGLYLEGNLCLKIDWASL